MSSRVFLSRLVFGLCAGLFVSNAIHAEDLSTSQRLNGANTRKAFAKTKQAAFASTVRLIRNGKLITHGTIVSKEGLLLTKASACVGAREAVLADGQSYPVRIRRRDERTDLALLQMMAKDKSFEPVQWSNEMLPKEGGWMVSANPKLKGLKVGVNSGTPRAIKREGGVIGVILGRDGDATGGIAIAEVVPRAAGATAGLKKGDVVTKVNGKSVIRREQVIELVGSHDPGDVVSIEVIRDERSFSYQVTLGHRSVTFEMFNRNLQMSGPVSKRKDNFPMIIQHDLPLPPEAMGGPVLDINGKAVGLNMARVDRVTTYALTAKVAQESLKTLNR